MPIEKSKENDGSTLNNFSGLTISNEVSKNGNQQSEQPQKQQQQQPPRPTGGSGDKYIPPMLRKEFQQKELDERRSQFNNQHDNRDAPRGHTYTPPPRNYDRRDNNYDRRDNNYDRRDNNYDRRDNNYDRRDSRDNRDNREERRDDNNNTNTDNTNTNTNTNERQDNNDVRRDDDFRGPPRGRDAFNNNSPSYRGGNDRWDNRSSGSSGGYGRPSAFSNNRMGGSSGGYGKRSQIDRYYDRWNQFKDSRVHKDMKRDDFTKNLLDEQSAEEIFKSQNNHGIDFGEVDDDDISIETSENICSALNSFMDVDLGDVLFRNIQYAKYTRPTPVQKSAIPIITKGRDLMACAQTGSGKTAAFLFPIISGILLDGAPEPLAPYRPGVPRPVRPRALVLAPTRELAQQIYEEACKFSTGSPVASVVVYGGAEISQQIAELDRGCDILVATTGRLVDLLSRGRVSLVAVKYLVLDEADRMLDMGFEPQIRQIIQDNDMPPNQSRQTLMFSATFPKPIQNLAADFLNKYIHLKVGVIGTTQNITQRIEYVLDDEKNDCLLDFIETIKAGALTLIFVETKRQCDSLAYFLNTRRYPTTCIHGDLSQYERESALESFRNGQTPYLVATDVASRGLHIPNVLYVINYDLPTYIDVYVHRIGRTGRAGKKGFAVSFFNEKNKPVAQDLFTLLRQSNQDIPEWFERAVYSFKPAKSTPPQKRYDNGGYGGKSNYHRGGSGGGYGNNNRNSRNNHDDYSMHNQYFGGGGGGSYN